jgi:hypothetical protein
MENGYSDEAGVALAYKTLRAIILSVIPVCGHSLPNTNALGAQSYGAFSTMLRINTSIVLIHPLYGTAGADERLLVNSCNQMRIEPGLNKVGRGRFLSSSQTRRKEWVDAMNELNSCNADETPAFNVSCLYSLLRMKSSPLQC